MLMLVMCNWKKLPGCSYRKAAGPGLHSISEWSGCGTESKTENTCFLEHSPSQKSVYVSHSQTFDMYIFMSSHNYC